MLKFLCLHNKFTSATIYVYNIYVVKIYRIEHIQMRMLHAKMVRSFNIVTAADTHRSWPWISMHMPVRIRSKQLECMTF